MRAGGASESETQFMGGWHDLPMSLTYQQAGSGEFDHAQELLSNPTLFTVEDVHLHHLRATVGNEEFQRRLNPSSAVDGCDSDSEEE